MHIEFDSAKNEANIRDRGLSFQRAAEFDFSTAIIDQDTRKAYPEARLVATGFLGARSACAVLHPRGCWHSRHQLSQGQRQRGKRL